MKKNGDLNFGQVTSRVNSTSSPERNETPSFWFKILDTSQANNGLVNFIYMH